LRKSLKVFYFRTYDNFTLRKIDLAMIDFNADKIKTIPLTAGTETIVDVTDMAK